MPLTVRHVRRALLTAALLSGVVGSSPLNAQGPAINVVPGTRVRVTAANQVAPLIANFMQMRGDTAVFIEEGAGRGIWSLYVGDIRKLEESSGERLTNRPYVLRGAAIGGGGGLLLGLVLANNLKPSDSGRKYNKVGNGAVGALLGAAIGAGIGSRFATENWTDVPLRRVSLAPFGPGGRGLTAAFSLAF